MLSSANFSSEAECKTLTKIISTFTGKFFRLWPFAKDFMISFMFVFVIGNLTSHMQSKNWMFYSLSLRKEKDFLLNRVRISYIYFTDSSLFVKKNIWVRMLRKE